jgi:hypothetical protein
MQRYTRWAQPTSRRLPVAAIAAIAANHDGELGGGPSSLLEGEAQLSYVLRSELWNESLARFSFILLLLRAFPMLKGYASGYITASSCKDRPRYSLRNTASKDILLNTAI